MRGEWLLPLAARALADLGADGAPRSISWRVSPRRAPRTAPSLRPIPLSMDSPTNPATRAQRGAFEDWYRAELARGRGSSDAPALWDRQRLRARMPSGLAWEAAYAWMRWGESLLRADRADRRAAARALRGATERAVPLEAAPVIEQVEALARSARIDLSDPDTLDHAPRVVEPDAPGARGPRVPRSGPHVRRDRRGAVPQRQDGELAHLEHAPQDRRRQPTRSRCPGDEHPQPLRLNDAAPQWAQRRRHVVPPGSRARGLVSRHDASWLLSQARAA